MRQTWKILLNGKELGRLVVDENDTAIYLPVPAGGLTAGDNTLGCNLVLSSGTLVVKVTTDGVKQ